MTDGGTITNLEHLFEVAVRHIYDDAVHLLRQLPGGIGARINPVIFASAFTRAAVPIESMVKCPAGDVPRVPAAPWDTAHTGYTCYTDDPNNDPARTEEDKKYMEARRIGEQLWEDWQCRNARLIPYTACKEALVAVEKPKVPFQRGAALGE